MKEILEKAIEHYGEAHQKLKAVEELSELIQAILKEMDCTDLCDWQDRQNNIDEEMADVEIMLAQLRMIYQNDKRVEKWKERKVGMLDLSIPEEEE